MQRPQKLANKVVEQWEQNLLLKVMQRKIQSAKSTISAIQGIKKSHPQPHVLQKPRMICLEVSKKEYWDFPPAAEQQQHVHHHAPTLPLCPKSAQLLSQSTPDEKPEDKEKCLHSTSNKTREEVEEDGKDGEALCSQQDICNVGQEEEYDQESPNYMDNDDEDLIALTERFHKTFKDNDDDLLSQIWSTCKLENSLFDDGPGLNQRRKGGGGGATTTTATGVFYLNPVPSSKLVNGKEKRLSKTQLSQPKKGVVRDPALVSQFMKKRETGWRE